jgi:hypothetical protein
MKFFDSTVISAVWGGVIGAITLVLILAFEFLTSALDDGYRNWPRPGANRFNPDRSGLFCHPTDFPFVSSPQILAWPTNLIAGYLSWQNISNKYLTGFRKGRNEGSQAGKS